MPSAAKSMKPSPSSSRAPQMAGASKYPEADRLPFADAAWPVWRSAMRRT